VRARLCVCVSECNSSTWIIGIK